MKWVNSRLVPAKIASGTGSLCLGPLHAAGFLAPLPLGLLLATASVFEAEGPTKQLPDSLPI